MCIVINCKYSDAYYYESNFSSVVSQRRRVPAPYIIYNEGERDSMSLKRWFKGKKHPPLLLLSLQSLPSSPSPLNDQEEYIHQNSLSTPTAHCILHPKANQSWPLRLFPPSFASSHISSSRTLLLAFHFSTTNLIDDIYIKTTFSHSPSSPTPPSLH